jgi:hypothetical protein
MTDCRPYCWGKEGKKIQAALAIEDPEESRVAARAAVREGLHSDQQARDNVIRFLLDKMRWIRVEDYADLLLEIAEIDPRASGTLDFGLLERLPREERLRIYGDALSTGVVKLKHGTTFGAGNALYRSAAEGLDELRPLMESQIKLAGSDAEFIFELLALTSGGKDREAAAARAVKRMRLMSAQEFEGRMESIPGFRRAVIEVAKFVCVESNDQRCGMMAEVTRQQQALAAEKSSGVLQQISDWADWRVQLRQSTGRYVDQHEARSE